MVFVGSGILFAIKSFGFYIRVWRKLRSAEKVLSGLVGLHGIWASSDRYRYQCWTRDACLAIFWPFAQFAPLRRRFPNIIRGHLTELCKRQSRETGRIPIVYADDAATLMAHLESIARKQQKDPYALKRLRINKFEQITENTRDSESLFIVAAMESGLLKNLHLQKGSRFEFQLRAAVWRAFGYLEKHVPVDENKLVLGGDWRDTAIELDDKPTLTNAVFLWRAYSLTADVDAKNRAFAINQLIHRLFWNEERGYFRNYPETYDTEQDRARFVPQFDGQTRVRANDCDRLGNALCVLWGIATREQSERILRYLTNTSYCNAGVFIGGVYLSPKTEEERRIVATAGTTVWPWVHNFVALAVYHHAQHQASPVWFNVAHELMLDSLGIEGFPEWCDPNTREGYGSPNQSWSAATFIRLTATLHPWLCRAYSVLSRIC
jgi:hypothetical protein